MSFPVIVLDLSSVGSRLPVPATLILGHPRPYVRDNCILLSVDTFNNYQGPQLENVQLYENLPMITLGYKGLIGSPMYKLMNFVTYYLWLVSFFLSEMTISVLHIGQGGGQAGKARSLCISN